MTNKTEKKKKAYVFWIIYGVLTLAAVLFWVFVIRYVRNCLTEYETTQPYHQMDVLLEELERGSTGSFEMTAAKPSRFEAETATKEAFFAYLKGKQLSYEKASSALELDNMTYELYADEEFVGTASLRQTSSKPMMLLLTQTSWDEDKLEVTWAPESMSVLLNVLDSYQIYVNDIPLDSGDATGQTKQFEQFGYSADYVKVPYIVEYQADGLYEKPDIRISDRAGNAVEFTQKEEDGRLLVEATDFAESEMDGTLRDFVLENARNYSNFFSGDIEDGNRSTKPIEYMFPQDSYYLELAEIYRREDLWMFNSHEEPEFANESVTHYIRYSEDFFSCDVYFEKNMILTQTGQKRTDITHSRFYYGNLDGRWCILDIETILDE